MAIQHSSNDELAAAFEQVADLLRAQAANPFRVRAYDEAAKTLRSLQRPAAEILEDEGAEGLEKLPAIGKSLASALEELIHTGRLRVLERLMGEVSPEDLFTSIPGIGDELAHRIHRDLEVETLEELELAAHDGRLESLDGFGPRRTRLVREALASMLSRSTRRRGRLIRQRETADPQAPPPVSLVLEVDERYRRLAAANRLRKIAPRRFNPEGVAWLPILHMDAGGWDFTAMFSNTARAHELGKTDDWVVIYFERDGHEGQCTVVTEFRGPMSGRRVVRGREEECRRVDRRPETEPAGSR